MHIHKYLTQLYMEKLDVICLVSDVRLSASDGSRLGHGLPNGAPYVELGMRVAQLAYTVGFHEPEVDARVCRRLGSILPKAISKSEDSCGLIKVNASADIVAELLHGPETSEIFRLFAQEFYWKQK